MGNLGIPELIMIGIVGLLVLGPRRLPEVAKGLGEAVRAFQKAVRATRDTVQDMHLDTPEILPADDAIAREEKNKSNDA